MTTHLYYFVNFLVLTLCLSPLLICLYETRNYPISRRIAPLIAFMALAVGASEFAWLTENLHMFSNSSTKSEEEIELKINLVKAFGVWVFSLPAIYLAISANLFSSYITTKK